MTDFIAKLSNIPADKVSWQSINGVVEDLVDGGFDITLKPADLITRDPWVDIRAYPTPADAVTAIGGAKKRLLIPTQQTFDADLAFHANTTVVAYEDAFLIANGVTVTINGKFMAGNYRIKTGEGTLVFGAGAVGKIYPEWWGVKADGTTDNVTAFSQVVASTNASAASHGNGVTIQFGDGTYYFATQNDAFTKSGICIKGSSTGGTTIKGAAGKIFRWEGATELAVGGASDLQFTYTSLGTNACCFYLSKITKFIFRDISVHNIGRFLYTDPAQWVSGIQLTNIRGSVNDSNYPTIELGYGVGVDMTDLAFYVKDILVPGAGGYVAPQSGTVFLKEGVGNFEATILNNLVIERYYEAFVFAPTAGKTCLNIWMTNVIADYCNQSALRCSEAGIITGMFITNSWFVGYYDTGLTFDGIIYNVSITKCQIRLCANDGISFTALSKYITISDCEIFAVQRYGIDIPDGAYYFNIHDNAIGVDMTVHGMPGQPLVGIHIGQNCANANISHNWAYGSANGYDFHSPTLLEASFVCKDNYGTADYDNVTADIRQGTGALYALPASTVTWRNYNPTHCVVYLSGGTVTLVEKEMPIGSLSPVAVGTPAVVHVGPGEGFCVTYSVAPTVVFEVQQ